MFLGGFLRVGFMAIQTINLTVPGGDTPRSANTKINANFSDQTNAASKLVGAATGKIPLYEDIPLSSEQPPQVRSAGANFNAETDIVPGINYLVNPANTGLPPDNDTHLMYGKFSYSYTTKFLFSHSSSGEGWIKASSKPWRPITTHTATYKTTTALGANVVVDNTGQLMRSTSSERYKDILAPLELDDAKYADAMALKPIVYRSTADADNPAYHFYSFSAEELGAYDPAFTLWRETETVADADGNVTEQPLAERQAEGININALLAMGHAIAIKQGELIKDLQDQVIEQREAIAALQQTNP